MSYHYDNHYDRELQQRATAAVKAIRRGADPMLTLSFVIWPSADVLDAQREAKVPGRSGSLPGNCEQPARTSYAVAA